MNLDYAKLFKRGWEIIWNHKFLWALGFLAALGGNSMNGNGQVNYRTSSRPGSGGPYNLGPEFDRFFEGLFRGEMPTEFPPFFQPILTTIIILACFLAVFSIIMFFVRLAAEGGMIHAVDDIEHGRESGFQKAMKDGLPHLLPFWGTRLLLGLPNFIFGLIFLAIGLSFFFSMKQDINAMGMAIAPLVSLALCSACILIPYNLVISLMIPISQRGIALRQQGVIGSIRHAWDMLRQHLGDILVLAVIFVLTGIVIAIVIGGAIFILSLPLILIVSGPLILALIEGLTPSFWQYAGVIVGVFVAMLIGSLVSAVYISFRSTTFTLAYFDLEGLEMVAADPEPKPEPAG